MSQNQSYFWQTTRHNVYLKRSSKLQMLIALLAVLTFATICQAEVAPKPNDDSGVVVEATQTKLSDDEQLYAKDELYETGNELPKSDATKESKLKAGGFVDAFTASISVILFTELGDKTFFIAAIMAMRHPRLVVFTGAITALALMTVLSVVFGMAATIIPKVYTYYISTALFAIFGLKMIYDGYKMKATDAQEEFEEVQSDLRKREDELLRGARGKFEDADTKRKNSNSDKEDDSGAGAAINSKTGLPTNKNPEMQHRQRKQPTYKTNLNNNNGCDQTNIDDDIGEFNESDVFLNGENIQMSVYHSSPALSSSALSNQTNQTICDEFTNSPNRHNYKASSNQANGGVDGAVLVHSASLTNGLTNNKASKLAGTGNSINSISSLSLNSTTAVGQANEGGSKKRLERDVSATLIQDPESGIVRKSNKRGPTYLTTRILMQAFTMTFLAEWGDRSQLTTIILAASKNVYGVITGGIIGHSICTGLAVVGGRIVAAKISVRTVTIVGGIVFLGFAVYALIAKPDDL